MPGFNGTGPRGVGPRTGGGRGNCVPRGAHAGAVYGVGRGGMPWGGGQGNCYGGGRGGGRRSMGNAAAAAIATTPVEESIILKDRQSMLENELKQIQSRMQEIDGDAKEQK